jgi:SSS family solute:Na+ symporter
MAVTIAVGMAYIRRQTCKQYFIASHSLSTPLIIALLFSEIIAGAGTIGNAAEAFRSGYSSVWANWGMFLGCILFVFLAATFFRAMCIVKGVMSVPEAYGHIFDKRSRVVMLLNVVIVYFILYAMQPVAAAAIIGPIFNADITLVTWIMSAIFILMTLTGGMTSIAKMNVLHAVVMYVGLTVVSIKALHYVGGIGVLQQSLPPSYFTFTQPNIFVVIAQAVGTAIGFLASANVVSTTFSAKSLATAKRGIFIAAVLIFPFALMPATIGICAKVMMPDIQPNAALFFMANELGSLFSGLVGMAIVAAIWSTGPALLLIICTTITKDFYTVFVRPQATDGEQMMFTRIIVVVTGISATFFGMNAGSILNQMLGAFQIRSVVGIVLVLALYYPRISKDGAFWSMLAGGIVASFWHFAKNPWGVAPLWPAAAVTLFVLFVFNIFNKERESEGYRMWRDAAKELKEKHL